MRISDWSSDVCSSDLRIQPQAVMLSLVGHEDIAADLPITFARLDGLDLRRAADGWHGVWQAGDIAHQFWLPEAMPDTAAFYAVTLPMDSLLELRIHAARRLWRSLTQRPPGDRKSTRLNSSH